MGGPGRAASSEACGRCCCWDSWLRVCVLLHLLGLPVDGFCIGLLLLTLPAPAFFRCNFRLAAFALLLGCGLVVGLTWVDLSSSPQATASCCLLLLLASAYAAVAAVAPFLPSFSSWLAAPWHAVGCSCSCPCCSPSSQLPDVLASSPNLHALLSTCPFSSPPSSFFLSILALVPRIFHIAPASQSIATGLRSLASLLYRA